jgi:hypothetical protein
LAAIASLFCQPYAGLGLRALSLVGQRRPLGLELLNLSFKPLAILCLLLGCCLAGLAGLVGLIGRSCGGIPCQLRIQSLDLEGISILLAAHTLILNTAILQCIGLEFLLLKKSLLLAEFIPLIKHHEGDQTNCNDDASCKPKLSITSHDK